MYSGCIDLIEILPKEQFSSIKDLEKLKTENLIKLYDDYAKLKIKDNDLKTVFKIDMKEREKQDKIKYDKKILLPPLSIFKNILDLVNLPYSAYSSKFSIKLFSMILPIQDFFSPKNLNDFIVHQFILKFGKNSGNRCQKFSKYLIEKIFYHSDNCNSLYYDKIITKSQIILAINLSNQTNVDGMIENLENILYRNINQNKMKIKNFSIKNSIQNYQINDINDDDNLKNKNYMIDIEKEKNMINYNISNLKEYFEFEFRWDIERVDRCAAALLDSAEHLKRCLHESILTLPSNLLETLPQTLPHTPPHTLPLTSYSNHEKKEKKVTAFPLVSASEESAPPSNPLPQSLPLNGSTSYTKNLKKTESEKKYSYRGTEKNIKEQKNGKISCSWIQDLLYQAEIQVETYGRFDSMFYEIT